MADKSGIRSFGEKLGIVILTLAVVVVLALALKGALADSGAGVDNGSPSVEPSSIPGIVVNVNISSPVNVTNNGNPNIQVQGGNGSTSSSAPAPSGIPSITPSVTPSPTAWISDTPSPSVTPVPSVTALSYGPYSVGDSFGWCSLSGIAADGSMTFTLTDGGSFSLAAPSFVTASESGQLPDYSFECWRDPSEHLIPMGKSVSNADGSSSNSYGWGYAVMLKN